MCGGCAWCLPLEERWQRANRTAERAGERLGLDPQSRAQLLVRLRAAGLIMSEAEQPKSLLGELARAMGLDRESGALEGADVVDAEEVTTG
ncbi:hypothetical protein GCM10027080_29190 [Pedococcus soli]